MTKITKRKMLPKFWREVTIDGDDEYETNDGVHYANSLFFHRGDKVIECKLNDHQLNELELFDVKEGHPAYDRQNPGRGVRAISRLKAKSIVGPYAGVYRPGTFAPENPYVFGTQPLKLDLVIDALSFGNITRYINDPKNSGKTANLKAEDVIIQKGPQTLHGVQFRTTRTIEVGEELLFEYEASKKGYWDRFGVKPAVIDLVSDETQVAKEMEPEVKKPKTVS